MPAAVTRMSTPPRSVDRASHDRVVVDGAGCVAAGVQAPAAELLDERDRLGARVVAHIGDEDVGALFREPFTTGPADAVGTARHHRDLLVQPAHSPPLSHDDVATCLSVRMTATIDIYDPDVYVDGPAARVLRRAARARSRSTGRTCPTSPGTGPCSRTPTSRTVAREPMLYSASEGGRRAREPRRPRASSRCARCCWRWTRPKHVAYRRPLAPSFKARVIGAIEDRIRAICREIMRRAPRKRGDVEFVHDVATLLPTQVVGELMGLPREDWDQIHRGPR